MIKHTERSRVDNQINKHLKSLIEHLDYTQEEVADKIGINKIHLNKVLNGKADVTMDLSKKLSSIPEFNLTPQEILFPPLEIECIGEMFPMENVTLFKAERPKIMCKFPISPGYICLRSYLMPRIQRDANPATADYDILIFDGKYIEKNELEKHFDNRFCLVLTEAENLICGMTLKNPTEENRATVMPIGSTAPIRNIKIKACAIVKIATNYSYHGIF